LAIPVLLILAVLWAAVLVPPVLRSRSQSRRGDFPSRLGSVTGRRSSLRSVGTRSGRPLHAVPAWSDEQARGRRPGNGTPPMRGASKPIASGAPAATSAAAQRRRRRVLIILSGAVLASLAIALMLGSPILWVAQALADVLLVVYLLLLLLIRRRGSLEAFQMDLDTWPPASRSAGSLPHPQVPPRPELALWQNDSSLRRTATR
jgi:Flp pilus assembly protein TadB